MDISVEVQNVSFIIDAEDESEAMHIVESRLEEIAMDWTELRVY